jgi:hypothetical protein
MEGVLIGRYSIQLHMRGSLGGETDQHKPGSLIATEEAKWKGRKTFLAELFLHSLNGADAFSRQLRHVSDGITLFQKRNSILVFFSLLVCRFHGARLAPQFAPLTIYCFWPDCKRKVMFSRSSCAQVESEVDMIGIKKDGYRGLKAY